MSIQRRPARLGLVALALCASAAGQAKGQWFQGSGYIGVGASRTATGELDDALAASSYPRFGSGAAQVSIGAYATVASRVMLGGEWVGVIKGSQKNAGRTIWLGGGFGTLGIGYAMHVKPRLRVYPRLAAGIGGLGLTFDSIEDTVNFRDALANPEAQAALSRGFQPSLTREHGIVDVGAGAEFLPSRSGRGALVGVRLGLIMAGSSSDWRFNKRPVRSGPAATMAGPYIRMVVGLGTWR